MDNLEALQNLGLTLPSAAYLAGAILFGVIGFAAFRSGRKSSRPRVKWIGVGLMLYPYAVSQTWQLYAVGLALCAGLYWFSE